MVDFIEGKDVAGEYFHVRDCYVWAEICYLDSPTDYREYLPLNRGTSPAIKGVSVMLDGSRPSASRVTFYPLLAPVIIFLLLAGYLLHLIVDSL
jgi:hypothetical protein